MSLHRQLSVLEATGLIRIAQVDPDLEYLFRHALVQDAAYDSLLKQDRKSLHLNVGEALETLYAERLEEFAPVLGHHFYSAQDVRALKYYTLAGDLAFAQNSIAEAVAHYSRAWEIAKWKGVAATGEQLAHLCVRLGRSLQLASRFPDAAALYNETIELAQTRSDAALQLAAQIELATVLCTVNPIQDFARGIELSHRTLALAREIGDPKAEAKSLWNMMLPERNEGDPIKAIPFGEQALAIARRHNLREQIAYILNDLGFCYMVSGEFERAVRVGDEAVALWRELGNIPMLTDALSGATMILVLRGETAQAIARWEESYRVSLSIEHVWGQAFSGLIQDLAYLQTGHPSQALIVNARTERLTRQAGVAIFTILKGAIRGYINGALGQPERGLEIALAAYPDFQLLTRMGIGLPQLIRLRTWTGDYDEADSLIASGYALLDQGISVSRANLITDIPLAEAESALVRGDYARVSSACATLQKYIDQLHWTIISPELRYFEARALIESGQPERARAILLDAEVAAAHGEARFVHWKILAQLARIEPDRHLAEEYLSRARDLLHFIADHTDEPDLRASFLAMPEVRAALEERL